ncbi:AAA-like domain-containing protein [Oscillatoriales cyanobacterium LEGE 11467]|uniref:AAA-like domain-containing protein n=2 Tax=Zarconia TaxID=2992130 RepID=A0A928Z834_9CYAN|nr:AAA-like domain-containing protein [Zarconia navalis LEGE 11467]
MTIDEVLALLHATRKKNLTPMQELVLRQAWKGQTYTGMAQEFHYDADYLKKAAAHLWHSLCELFEVPITKSNFRTTLEERSLTPEQKRVAIEFDRAIAQTRALEFPSGPVALNSPFYVARPEIEELIYTEISKPGSVTRIKAPSQMGKTSLMLRVLERVSRGSDRLVRVDFNQADNNTFDRLDRFLRWFCLAVGRQLQLPPRLEMYWDEEIGSKISCTLYFQGYLLEKISDPLVLVLHEVDRVFEYPAIASEFLPLLRSWYEEAKQVEIWQQLRLVVVHNTDIYIPLKLNQSPFNVGLPIQLPEFTASQVQDLADRHGLNWLESDRTEQLINMVGGHPYLVRLALYWLGRQEFTLEQLLKAAPTLAGIYRDRLRHLFTTLKKYPELEIALQQVVADPEGVALKPVVAYKLESMGLIRLDGNRCVPSCELYRLYFSEQLPSEESSVYRLQELEQENQELKLLCGTDHLTELVNRRGFDGKLDLIWQQSKEEKAPLSLILSDIDFFRIYNKTRGHKAGDECLCQVAGAICQEIHRPSDVVARYGGEEFAVLLPNTDAAGASYIAENIRRSVKALGIEREYQIGFPASTITVSLGVVSTIPGKKQSTDDLIQAAEEALHQSKQQGRDRVTLNSNLTPHRS